MKDKIIRLRFRKDSLTMNKDEVSKYEIVYNVNEDENALNISIHHTRLLESDTEPTSKKSKGAPSANRRVKDPEKFRIKINNHKGFTKSFDKEDVVVRNIDDNNYEAIYQITIDLDQFIPEENVITFYSAQHDTQSEVEIGSLAFFVETENNFTTVRLDRPGVEPTADEILWKAINDHFLDFKEYETFIDTIICRNPPNMSYNHVGAYKDSTRSSIKARSPFIKSEEYNLIKFATDFYMLAKFGLDTKRLGSYVKNTGGRLPYYDIIIDRIKDDLKVDDTSFTFAQGMDDCEEREEDRLFNPYMIELIWSYWMEQGMLVQTMNVINLRFQNIKGSNYTDRLMRFDTDPLRPLSHILWGYIQDEQHRLSLPRRLNEYDHEYGLTLTGRAVPRINPVDTRVKFLEAFHSLLTQSTIFFRESDDTTRIADAFPILNSLKEVHLLLAEGNHNAYGNLTWTARQEMMMQQYILSRPEMREFLGGRIMVPYPETWMDRVDTMRNIQGWGGTGIVHYYELAVHGELILLSIRYGNWSNVKLDRNNAANWVQRFRNSIQRYVHAYRAVTGVDLSVDQIIQLPSNFAIQPAYLIQQRLIENNARIRRA